MSWLGRLVSVKRCPFGCGAELGFCQCGKNPTGNRHLTGRSRVVENGKVTQGAQPARGGRTRKRRR